MTACVLCGGGSEVEYEGLGPLDRSCESAVRGNLLGADSVDFKAMKLRLWRRYRDINERYRNEEAVNTIDRAVEALLEGFEDLRDRPGLAEDEAALDLITSLEEAVVELQAMKTDEDSYPSH